MEVSEVHETRAEASRAMHSPLFDQDECLPQYFQHGLVGQTNGCGRWLIEQATCMELGGFLSWRRPLWGWSRRWATVRTRVVERRRVLLLAAATLLLTLQALLLMRLSHSHHKPHHHTHDDHHHVPPSSADMEQEYDDFSMANHLAVTLLFELAKLFLSTILLLISLKNSSAKGRPKVRFIWKESRVYCLPALVYLINDNLLFSILHLMDAPTFEILGNMRILTTSLFHRLIFRQQAQMTQVQWASVVLLCVGTATSQLVTCGDHIISAIPIWGFTLVLLYCCLSGFAGVFLEYLMKRRTEQSNSLHYQSVQLYSYGVLLNAIPLYTYYREQVSIGVLALAGRDLLTAVTVINHALTGLTISALVKYVDNISRVYAHSASMLVTMGLSSLWAWRLPSVQFLFGAVIVTISIHLHHLPPPPPHLPSQSSSQTGDTLEPS